MYLTDEDLEMLNGSIEIMAHMYKVLRQMDPKQAKADVSTLDERMADRYKRKDKKDTRLFDMVAEESISLGYKFVGHNSLFLQAYNEEGVIITEEKGKVGSSRIEQNTPVIISDPIDRTRYLEEIIAEHGKSCKTMGEVFDLEVKRIGKYHARVEACTSSVTLLKDNMIKYSLILNLFTGESFVAYEHGVFQGNITKIKNVNDLKRKVEFKTDEGLDMLCFCKGEKYENNRKGTHLRFFPRDESIKLPGGPNRFTYLLKDKKNVSNIKVIAHNGEKIQESLPNIAVAFFSEEQLCAYKLFCDRQHYGYRASKVLTPNLQNSIYNDGLLINTGLKLVFLNNHEYPSQFRDTTVITPVENDSAVTLMEGMVKRGYAIKII